MTAAVFVSEFADMMVQGNPHFIQSKSYMHIGMSTQRLKQDHMLEMNEIRNFASGVCPKMPSFKIMDESEISRIVVIQNKVRYVDRWIKEYKIGVSEISVPLHKVSVLFCGPNIRLAFLSLRKCEVSTIRSQYKIIPPTTAFCYPLGYPAVNSSLDIDNVIPL